MRDGWDQGEQIQRVARARRMERWPFETERSASWIPGRDRANYNQKLRGQPGHFGADVKGELNSRTGAWGTRQEKNRHLYEKTAVGRNQSWNIEIECIAPAAGNDPQCYKASTNPFQVVVLSVLSHRSMPTLDRHRAASVQSAAGGRRDAACASLQSRRVDCLAMAATAVCPQPKSLGDALSWSISSSLSSQPVR